MYEATPGYGFQQQSVIPWSVAPLNVITLVHRGTPLGDCGCLDGCGSPCGLGFTESGAADNGSGFINSIGSGLMDLIGSGRGLLLLGGAVLGVVMLAGGPGAKLRRRKLAEETERHKRSVREIRQKYDRLGVKEAGRRLKRLGKGA